MATKKLAESSPQERKKLPIMLGRFRIRWDRLLGRGSYWSVYAAWDPRTGEQSAVKIQRDSLKQDGMLLEGAFLQRLKGSKGIPTLLDWGTESGWHFLALERLGLSVQQLADQVGGTLSVSTVLKIGIALVSRLKTIHRLGVLHRDVKPENLLMGAPYSSRKNELYLVDFGFSKQFHDPSQKVCLSSASSQEPRKRFVGTPLFASIAAHEGIELSEKDDLESALYTLVHLYYGQLPWTTKPNEPNPSVGDDQKDWFAPIADSKRASEAGDLALGTSWLPRDHPKRDRPLPGCFATALRYVVSPGGYRSGRPDCDFLIDLFHRQLENLDRPRKGWDWDPR